ncbi:MAG: hypothetical protein PHO08_05970 [Methylococcales bacterium]|nr:hypothetical protein [Methylococcales bacterium]
MSLDGARYLILLNHRPSSGDTELESWGFHNGVVAIEHGEDDTRHFWKNTEWLNLNKINSQCYILVYCDNELPGGKPACKKKLYNIVGSAARIWHHGGVNVDDATLELVWDKFKEQNFESAGFTRDAHLMPFSETSPYPWNDDIKKVKDLFKNTQTLSFHDALIALHDAWNKAEEFFHFEDPAQRIIEALFPLYVDLGNRGYSGLTEADFQLALNTAREDVISVLSSIGLTSENVIGIWDKVTDPQQRRLAEPGITLLKALKNLPFDKADDFLEKFKALSVAYTRTLNPPSEAVSPGQTELDSP